MECPFFVGDEVECVADHFLCVSKWWQRLFNIRERLAKRKTFIVADIGWYSGPHAEPQAVVALVGVKNYWTARSFRKVTKPRTSIEQFTRVPVDDTSRWDRSRRHAPVKERA